MMWQQTEKMYIFITNIAKEYTQYRNLFLTPYLTEPVVTWYKINCSLDN